MDDLRARVARYYAARFGEHGASARGVDWNSTESQHLRFRQLTRILPDQGEVGLLDYGCGYGELLRFLEARPQRVRYLGFDLVDESVRHAREQFGERPGVRFVTTPEELAPQDFTIASGIFGVKGDAAGTAWEGYVREEVARMAALSRRGFAFNMLTSYSDPERMRPDLYYADPLEMFDFLKRTYSRNVALLHDYDLYEFTMLVRLA